MRKIPVLLNGDFERLVGFLEIDDDKISDEMLTDMYVSWQYIPDQKKVIAVSLVPMQALQRKPFNGDTSMLPLCSNCKDKVPYGSFHARGTSEIDFRWICQRKE